MEETKALMPIEEEQSLSSNSNNSSSSSSYSSGSFNSDDIRRVLSNLEMVDVDEVMNDLRNQSNRIHIPRKRRKNRNKRTKRTKRVRREPGPGDLVTVLGQSALNQLQAPPRERSNHHTQTRVSVKLNNYETGEKQDVQGHILSNLGNGNYMVAINDTNLSYQKLVPYESITQISTRDPHRFYRTSLTFNSEDTWNLVNDKKRHEALEKYQRIVNLEDSIDGCFDLIPLLKLNKGDKVAFKSDSSWWIDYNQRDRMDKLELTPGIIIGTIVRDIDRRFLLNFMSLRRPLPKIPIIIESLIVKRRRDEIILSKGEQIRTQNRDMLQERVNMMRSLYEEALNRQSLSSFGHRSNSLDPRVRSRSGEVLVSRSQPEYGPEPEPEPEYEPEPEPEGDIEREALRRISDSQQPGSMDERRRSDELGTIMELRGGNYPDCCDNIDNHNYCLRISDNKKFKLPRKFKKQDCLKDKKIKSFSKRSSCAPFKDCKKTKKKSIKRKNRKSKKSKKRKNSRKKRSKKKK